MGGGGGSLLHSSLCVQWSVCGAWEEGVDTLCVDNVVHKRGFSCPLCATGAHPSC